MLNGGIASVSKKPLITEFTDIKSIVHKVKHSIITTADMKDHQDKICDDLYRVFTQGSLTGCPERMKAHSCKGGNYNGNSVICEKVNRTRK